MGLLFNSKNKFIQFLHRNLFTIIVLVSILVGFLIGIVAKTHLVSEASVVRKWLALPGDLFIRALQLLMVPVIFIGVTTACSSLSLKNNLKITLLCTFFVILTHFLATSIGVFGSFLLKLNTFQNYQNGTENNTNLVLNNNNGTSMQKNSYDIVNDLLGNLIPKNLVKSAFSQQLTKYIAVRNQNGTIERYERRIEYPESSNILGLLFFSILLGVASSFVPNDKSKIFRDFFSSFNSILLEILKWFVLFTPIGMCSLIIEAIFEVENLADSFRKIGLFTLVCVCCLIFYGLFVLSSLVLVFIRKKNPFKYYFYFLDPALLAFASTSGAVCMHKSMEVCDSKIKMDMRITEFAIPFYTALQSDGSGLFITISCGFLAYYSNIVLSTGDYITIILMTCILCACLPSVPSSSIATILVILDAVNVPSSNVFLLFMVEWILDRVRTMVNVYSHCICTVITYEMTKSNLKEDDTVNNKLENNHTKDEINENSLNSNLFSNDQHNYEEYLPLAYRNNNNANENMTKIV